jgi:hypothetical protein
MIVTRTIIREDAGKETRARSGEAQMMGEPAARALMLRARNVHYRSGNNSAAPRTDNMTSLANKLDK